MTENITSKSMCGTPEYLAPEILDKQGHGKAVDWYTLGALMYEMLTGLPPFYTEDREKLFERIRRGNLPYPPYLSPDARNLLEALLTRDPTRRLGGGPLDAQEVKCHPFFRGTDWQAVLERRYVPPFRPSLQEDTDVKYFDKEFVSMPVVNSLEHTLGGGTLAEPVHFDGFTYQGNRGISSQTRLHR